MWNKSREKMPQRDRWVVGVPKSRNDSARTVKFCNGLGILRASGWQDLDGNRYLDIYTFEYWAELPEVEEELRDE